MPLPAHGTVVLVSDWLDPLDNIEAVIRHYASGGVRGHLVQVLDPAEEDLPFDGHVKFEGLEAEGQHTIRRVEAVRTAYGARLAAQKEGLQRLTRSTDWTVHLHRTDKSPQTVLLSLYLAMADLRRLTWRDGDDDATFSRALSVALDWEAPRSAERRGLASDDACRLCAKTGLPAPQLRGSGETTGVSSAVRVSAC